ncbi:MAG: hypothetical protein ABS76_07900 [Pelagibacterium sp. SCN 64-44]|nr:MAG: hypothetical protein ABS76_07900 [Pelagibacterium sp. SCN 64-44]
MLAYAAAIGFFYVGTFANIAAGPFVYIDYFGLSPTEYGLVFSSGVVGLMVANVANVRAVAHIGSDRMLLLGAMGAALFGLALVLAVITNLGGVWALIVTQFLFNSMNGLILANGVAGALSSITDRAGAASAVVGAIQYGSGMIGSALVGLSANGTPLPMGIVIAAAGLGCLICAWRAVSNRAFLG